MARSRFLILGAFLALLWAVPGAAPQQAAPALSPIGPLGYWKGDDADPKAGAADASGNKRAGVYSAGATVTNEVAALKFPNPGCFKFDGATGMITVPDSPELRIIGDITVSFWLRRTAAHKDWVRLIGKGNGGQRNFGIWQPPGDTGQIKFQIYNQAGGSVLDLDSPGGIPLNQWAHVVCVVASNRAQVWINGQVVASGARTGEPGISADPLTFGFAGYHAYYTGQLDDIRLYDRALSGSEIVYLAQGNGIPVAPAGLASASADSQKVSLKWTGTTSVPPAGTTMYYTVKRTATPGKDHAVVGWGLTSLTFIDPTVEPGKTYGYVVVALNSAGESAPSNEVTVAVPAK